MQKYTQEMLEVLVPQSSSVRDLMLKLGMTSIYRQKERHMEKIIAQYKIDTSHWPKPKENYWRKSLRLGTKTAPLNSFKS